MKSGSLSHTKRFLFSLFLGILIFICSEFFLKHTLGSLEKPAPSSVKAGQWAMIPEESWVEYHPKLGWFQKADCTSRLVKQGWEIPIRTNSIGLRGTREYDLKKPAGKIRAAVIGDSFAFGFGVQEAEAFPALLEKMNPDLEVMNFGVPGYGVDQMAVLLEEKVFSYRPDVILLAIYPEDFWRATRAFNDAGHGKPYFVLNPSGDLTLQHVPVPRNKNFTVDQFPVILKKDALEEFFSRSYLVKLIQKVGGRLKKALGWEDPDSSDEWQLGRVILKKMNSECRAMEIPMVIVLIPPFRWITGTTEPVRESMARFAAEEKVSFLDLTDAFRRASRENPGTRFYIPEDLHWTPAGHQWAAQKIDPLLAEQIHARKS